MLNETNYLVIKQAISPELCELISRYAQLKASTHPKIKKDKLKNTHREYGDPLMETLLEQLTPAIEEATALALWPTLSFYYTYKNGSQLEKHTDRSSCQIVAGLCIGADDVYKKTNGTWPLIFNLNGKAESVALEFGDIVVFRGYDIEHWREAFTGAWFISAIFGFVEKNGPFAFQKFDQRRALGMPHVGMIRWFYGYLKNKLRFNCVAR